MDWFTVLAFCGILVLLFSCFSRLGQLQRESLRQAELLRDVLALLKKPQAPQFLTPPVAEPVADVAGDVDSGGIEVDPEPVIPLKPETEPPVSPPESFAWSAPVSPETPPADDSFESRAVEVINRIVNWIMVGEEYRTPGIAVEYVVATTWLVRGAVLALLAGVGFFLRYAYLRNLISPELRVGIAVVVGIAMLTAGMRLIGRKYHLIGIGLLGAGFGAFYFSLYSALTLYHLCGATTAFLLSIVITAAAMTIAVRLDLPFAALVGVLGGYIAPILYSTGEKNLVGLFAYLLLLGIGVFYTAWRRDWKLLNVISFFFTMILYGSALHRFYLHRSASDFSLSIIFLAAYFILFSLLPVVFNLGRRIGITLLELFFLVANSTAFLAVGITLTARFASLRWAATVPLGMTLFDTVLFLIALRRRLEDKILLHTWLTLGAVGVAASIPLALDARYITFSYAVLAIAFFALARAAGSGVLRNFGLLIYLAALFHWVWVDIGSHFCRQVNYSDGVTGRLLTLGALTVAAFVVRRLLTSPDTEHSGNSSSFAPFFAVVGIAELFVLLTCEVNLALGFLQPTARSGGISVLWGLFALMLITVGILRKNRPLRWTGLVLFTVTVGKIFLSDLARLDSIYRIIAFMALGLALLAGAFLYIRFRERFERDDEN